MNVWNVRADGKTDEETALKGIECLENFIREIGLPTTLRELGITDEKTILDTALSVKLAQGSYKNMEKQDISEILNKCR